MSGPSSVVRVDSVTRARMDALLAEGTNEPSGKSDGRGGEGTVLGISQGTAVRNVSAENDRDLMFMAGECVVLLKRLGGGLCMGYCEGVVGRFKEADVDFTATPTSLTVSPSTARATPTAPPIPPKNRSRAGSISSSASDKKAQNSEAAPHLRETSSTLEGAVPALPALSGHPLAPSMGIDSSANERAAPRKLMSEENLKASSGTPAQGRRQILSSPPAPHFDPSTAPGIPLRSSSRQSKGARSQKQSSGAQSLATKSSASSMDSLADPYGSSTSITMNSLEIKSNELSPDQQRLSPVPHRQLSKASSRKNSLSSRAPSPVQHPSRPVTPVAGSSPLSNIPKTPRSRRQSMENSEIYQQQEQLEKEQRHQEHDHYLSSILDDLRSRTNHALQKTGFSMAPNAGLYADRESNQVDLSVVQMPSSDPPSSDVAVSSATVSPLVSGASTASSAPASSSVPGVSFDIPRSEVDVGMKSGGSSPGVLASKEGRARSRSIREDNRAPRTPGQSGTPMAESSEPAAPQSVFERLNPWHKLERRQRSNSGPARHPDSSIQQKMDDLQSPKILVPQHEAGRPSRQRRPSEATTITALSIGTTYSYPPQHTISAEQRANTQTSKHRTKNWLGIGRRNSAYAVEDTRKPHPLGHGIEGGIVSRHLSALVDEDEDDEDTDPHEDDENVEEEGRKSSENSRFYINDYGFIYDLDDEMNQGQDLTGTGSAVGANGPLGSNISTLSDIERKKASKRQKYNRENELKWIHAATRLQADNVRKSTKYKKLVRKGVPTSVRGRVWLFLAKADLYRKPGLFEELCKRGHLPIHEVIERDIHRCYPDHVHFRDGMGGTGQQDLHSILKAYAHYKPSVGYCQGMGRLVGMMLMQMPVEDAFWLLVATIEGYMQDYYTPSLRQLRIDAQVFERLLRDQDPPLAEHLEKNDVIPLMYMTQWFMTLYSMSLPWASVLRVWDVFYFDGVKALFRVGLAILHLCRDHLLNKCPTSSELLAYVLHIPLDILAPKPLLEAALQIKLRKQSVQKLIAVTAESMDAAATATGDASKLVRKPTHTTTATSNDNNKNNADNTTNTAAQQTTATKATTLSRPVSQPPSATVSAPASSASPASSSFSPLGVFKTRKRAGTIHK